MVGASGINITEQNMHSAIWWENLKEKKHLKDLDIDDRNI
jgi:hypothetical protein